MAGFIRRLASRVFCQVEVERKSDTFFVTDFLLGPAQFILVTSALVYAIAFQLIYFKGYLEGAVPEMSVFGLVKYPDPPGKDAVLPPLATTSYCQDVPWNGFVTWAGEPASDYKNSSDCLILSASDVDTLRFDDHRMLFIPVFRNIFEESLECGDPLNEAHGPCNRPEWNWKSVRHSYVLAPELLQISLHHTVSVQAALGRTWEGDDSSSLATREVLSSSRGPLCAGELTIFPNLPDSEESLTVTLPNECGISSEACGVNREPKTEDSFTLGDIVRGSQDAATYFFKNGGMVAGQAYGFDPSDAATITGREQGLKLRIYVHFSNLDSWGIPRFDRVSYRYEVLLVAYSAQRTTVQRTSATQRIRMQEYGVHIEVVPGGKIYELSPGMALVNLSAGTSLVFAAFTVVATLLHLKDKLGRRLRRLRKGGEGSASNGLGGDLGGEEVAQPGEGIARRGSGTGISMILASARGAAARV